MHTAQVYFQQKGLILSHSYVLALLLVKLLCSMLDRVLLLLECDASVLCCGW